MLDYYFCQECQTYHQPNRVINGEILSACQCSISTQPSFDQTNANSRRNFGKFIQHSPFKQNTIHIPPGPYSGDVRYQSPRMESPAVNVRTLPGSGRKFQNMPFISIIDEENRERMRNIIMAPQPRQNNPPIFMSPRKIREQVTVRKSVSPLARSQRKIITTSPTRRIIAPAPTVHRMIPIQQAKPSVVLIKTPIQTVSNLAFPEKMQTRINTLLTDPYHDQYQSPSIKVINNQVIKRAVQISPGYQNRVTLDRVTGERYADDFSDENQYRQRRVVLDRVTADENVVYQAVEKENCCGQMCYH